MVICSESTETFVLALEAFITKKSSWKNVSKTVPHHALSSTVAVMEHFSSRTTSSLEHAVDRIKAPVNPTMIFHLKTISQQD
jgi:hypothetical protein